MHHPASKGVHPYRRRALQAGGVLAYSCGASLETRAASCYKRYISDKVCTGPQRSQTPRTSYDAVKGASSMLDKLISRSRHSRP
jgi:hypothetical protein